MVALPGVTDRLKSQTCTVADAVWLSGSSVPVIVSDSCRLEWTEFSGLPESALPLPLEWQKALLRIQGSQDRCMIVRQAG